MGGIRKSGMRAQLELDEFELRKEAEREQVVEVVSLGKAQVN